MWLILSENLSLAVSVVYAVLQLLLSGGTALINMVRSSVVRISVIRPSAVRPSAVKPSVVRPTAESVARVSLAAAMLNTLSVCQVILHCSTLNSECQSDTALQGMLVDIVAFLSNLVWLQNMV